MQSSSAKAKNILSNQIIRYQKTLANKHTRRSPYDVFINHRSIDTKKNVSMLLYDHLARLGLRSFLDSKSMKPGDKLFDHIDVAVKECKLGIAVFSPQYCDSYFCLHELAMMMECKKKVVPIFCDVKPSQLGIKDKGICSTNDIEKFDRALEEAKYTVGISFDTSTGNWPEFLRSASDAVMRNLFELEAERLIRKKRYITTLNNNKAHSL